jgi:uncharacterized protein YggT (Ycf19 family)
MERVVVKVAKVLLWLVYIWVTITLVLLLLTFILELFGANPNAGFVEWVYRSVDTAMAPFRGIFKPIHLTADSTLDTSVLFAMIVYGFVAIGLHVAIDWITRMARKNDLEAAQASVAPPTVVGSTHVLQLTGPSGASASARLTPNQVGTSVDLSAVGLDPNRSYSVWLQNDRGIRVLAGTFEPGQTGAADISFVSNATLANTVGFGLTVLPSAADPNQTDVLASRL